MIILANLSRQSVSNAYPVKRLFEAEFSYEFIKKKEYFTLYRFVLLTTATPISIEMSWNSGGGSYVF